MRSIYSVHISPKIAAFVSEMFQLRIIFSWVLLRKRIKRAELVTYKTKYLTKLLTFRVQIHWRSTLILSGVDEINISWTLGATESSNRSAGPELKFENIFRDCMFWKNIYLKLDIIPVNISRKLIVDFSPWNFISLEVILTHSRRCEDNY